jgi:hypothetical protein
MSGLAAFQNWIDEQARIAHRRRWSSAKQSSSRPYNWTCGAAANSEDLNLISSPAVATAYVSHWHNRLAVSVRFGRSEDWCRVSTAEAQMRGRRPVCQPPQARGLRRVILLVPESCAEGLGDLVRVFRARQQERTAFPPLGWQRLSPNAELMVDPRSGVRCAIRDTRAAGAERCHWTETVVGEPEPVAAGTPGDIRRGAVATEAALGACSTDEREQSEKRNGTDG